MDRLGGVGRGRVGWLVLGVALFLIVGYVLVSYIGALVFAIFVYYATRPVYRRLSRYSAHPDLVVTATLLAFTLPMLVVVAYAGLVGMRALDEFLRALQLDQIRAVVQPYVDLGVLLSPQRVVDQVIANPQRFLGSDTPQQLGRLLEPVAASAGAVVTVLTQLFLLITFAFYLLRDDQKIAAWFERSFDYGDVVTFANGIDDDLQTVFFGNLLTIIVTGAIAVVVYYGLDLLAPAGAGIGHPLLLGSLVGIATLVPIVGMKLVYVPFAALLFGEALWADAPLWFPVVFVAVTFVVVDTIPDFFVRSYVSAGSLNTGLVLFSYVLGTLVFGWWGLFFGPIVLVVFVHFAREVFPRLIGGRWS